jgi:hypothetical protein
MVNQSLVTLEYQPDGTIKSLVFENKFDEDTMEILLNTNSINNTTNEINVDTEAERLSTKNLNDKFLDTNPEDVNA